MNGSSSSSKNQVVTPYFTVVWCSQEEGEWRWKMQQQIEKEAGGMYDHPEDLPNSPQWKVGDRLFVCINCAVYLVTILSVKTWSRRYLYRLKFATGYKLNVVSQGQLNALRIPSTQSAAPALTWFGKTKCRA